MIAMTDSYYNIKDKNYDTHSGNLLAEPKLFFFFSGFTITAFSCYKIKRVEYWMILLGFLK